MAKKQRDLVLRTSAEMFLKLGLKRVSVDDICTELRMSKKTFYSFFKTKEDLIVNILDAHRTRLIKPADSKDESENAIDVVMRDVYTSKRFMSDKKFTNIIYDLNKYYPDVMVKFKEQRDGDLEVMTTKLIERGVAEDIFRKDIDMTVLPTLLNTGIRESFTRLAVRNGVTVAELFEKFCDIFILLVANEKGLTYYREKYVKNNDKNESTDD